jgi:hypothetical protein
MNCLRQLLHNLREFSIVRCAETCAAKTKQNDESKRARNKGGVERHAATISESPCPPLSLEPSCPSLQRSANVTSHFQVASSSSHKYEHARLTRRRIPSLPCREAGPAIATTVLANSHIVEGLRGRHRDLIEQRVQETELRLTLHKGERKETWSRHAQESMWLKAKNEEVEETEKDRDEAVPS